MNKLSGEDSFDAPDLTEILLLPQPLLSKDSTVNLKRLLV